MTMSSICALFAGTVALAGAIAGLVTGLRARKEAERRAAEQRRMEIEAELARTREINNRRHIEEARVSTPEIHNHYYTTPQTPQPQQYSQPVQTINPITPYQNYYPQTQQMSMGYNTGYNTGYYNQPSYIQQTPVANYAYSEENLRGKPGYVEPVYKGEMEIAKMSRMQNVQNILSRFNPFNNTNNMMRNPFSNCYPVANYAYGF